MDYQTLIVLVIVAAAAVALAAYTVRTLRRKGGSCCGFSPSCGPKCPHCNK
ncbi:MAG: hypothetical protein LBO04_05565 [Spirochaetaceae bacterium]|jgi:hypothetical protein|nr:hypothetical protein [Spirochaetaceae bacterium]